MSSEVEKATKWQEEPPWLAQIDIDEYERLAGIGYEPRQLALFYRVAEKEFLWYFNLIGSPLRFHYERGQLVQRAKEGLSMAEDAQTGNNVTQAQRFDKFRQAVGYRNSVSKIFFGEIG
ncbi:MAG: hypothetical protein LBN24_13135 [Mediterranea sp.]|jgi:hypothetical protein|nr:hypothetical protein [Mediterranea sp.]